MKSALVILLLIHAAVAAKTIAVTEILKNPDGRETDKPGGASHEFVEIANTGHNAVSLSGVYLSDGTDVDSIIPVIPRPTGHDNCITGTTTLAPGQCALILDPDYFETALSHPSSRFNSADSTLLVTVDDGSIGNGLSATDGVMLYRGSRSAVDTLLALVTDKDENVVPRSGKIVHESPPGITEGYSMIPRTVLLSPGSFIINPDSLSPGSYSGIRNGWIAEWRFIDIEEQSVVCSLALSCCRADGDCGAQWRIDSHRKRHSKPLCSGTLDNTRRQIRTVCTIYNDSSDAVITLSHHTGETTWDIDLSSLWQPPGSIAISEIAPRAAGAAEWFEIVNIGERNINLLGWRFGASEHADTLTTTNCILSPGRYAVIAQDMERFSQTYPSIDNAVAASAWHALSNYRDTLILWDSDGRVQETVRYESSWFDSWDTESIERLDFSRPGIDQTNWICAEKPTPGQPNRSTLMRNVEEASLEIGPVPFTPNGDSRDDLCAIRLSFPPSSRVRVKIYGFEGRVLKEFGGSLKTTYLWDGNTERGTPAPVGPFFVVAEVTCENKNQVLRRRGIIWR
jgi:hypothetical protein